MKITLPPLGIDPVPAEVNEEPEEPEFRGEHYSHTQMNMYKRCSLQYYYRYVLGLKEPPSMALAIGSGGHTALEVNGRHKIATGTDMPISDLLDAASTFIDREVAEVEDKGEEDLTKDRALASIRVYHQTHAPNIVPAAVEMPFTLDINDDEHDPIRPIVGKIDLVTTKTKIIDYKFASKNKSQGDVDLSDQLTLYAKVFNRLTGRFASTVGLMVMTPGSTRTPPDARLTERPPEDMTPEVQQRRFDRLDFSYRETARSMEAGITIPADDPRTCSWCGFRDRCQSSRVTELEAATIRAKGR